MTTRFTLIAINCKGVRCSEFTIKGSAPNFNSFTITEKSALRAATCNALLHTIEQNHI